MKKIGKKWLAVLLCLTAIFAIFGFAACGEENPSGGGQVGGEQTEEYTVFYDVNGGDELTTTETTVIYGEKYTLIKPTRTGYTFLGWHYRGVPLTDENGKGLFRWNSSKNLTVVAKWQINEYAVALDTNNSSAGTVTGAGNYVYDSSVTIMASTNKGYTWLGWYDGDTLLTTATSYTFVMSADNTSYTAKWNVSAEMSNFLFSSSTTTCTISGVKDNTVTEIVVPDYVTTIESGAFKECTELTSIILPFVGGSKSASKGYDEVFGYIFGYREKASGSLPENGEVFQYKDTSGATISEWIEYYYYIPMSLKKVTITGGNILYGAFYNCNNLTNIEISNSVTSIGSFAFRDCSGLTSFTIPDSVESIGSSIFSGCSNLTEITLPFVGDGTQGNILFGYIFGKSSYTGGTETKQYYGSWSYVTYYIPTLLKKVTITGGNIFYGAFSGCSNLTSIEILDGVERIGDYAFSGCSNLTSIEIPDGVESIGDCAFNNCSNLTSIEIPDGVESIGDYAFSNCSNLTGIEIPDGVMSIGDYAFRNCSSLTDILVAENNKNYQSIDGNLYSKDEKTLIRYAIGKTATSFMIPDGVTSIGSYAFDGCVAEIKWGNNPTITSIGKYAFAGYKGTSITIPDSVTSIGYCAFGNCSSLTEITVPFVGAKSSVTSSDTYQYPFGYIFGETSYTGGTATKQYYYGSSTSSTKYNTYYIPTSLKKVTITGGNILYGAFYNCSNLTSIEIPESVTSIGSYAFYGCRNLMSVTIGNDVTSIGSSAFGGCLKLVEIYNKSKLTITAGNTSYGGIASVAKNVYTPTSGASKLSKDENGYMLYIDGEDKILMGYVGAETDLILPSGITQIYGSAFYDCSSLTSIEIPDSVTSIGKYTFVDCVAEVKWGDNPTITSIGEYAFAGYKGTSIVIPDSVTSIGGVAFIGCSSLTSIEIPDGVMSIGRSAFYDCSSLTSIEIPNGVTSIGESAFYDCSSLTGVYITDIAAWCKIAFGGSYAQPLYYAQNLYLNNDLITELIIPDSVTSIGSYAFYNCRGLTSVTIGNSVTSIGDSAFGECFKLVEIYNKSKLTITAGGGVASVARNVYTPTSGVSKLSKDENGYMLYIDGEDKILMDYVGAESDLILPSGITQIHAGAFYDCGRLTSIAIPESVTNIGDYAFSDCSSLTSITIPDGVTSIGRYAFADCVAEIKWGNNPTITSIGEYAFANYKGTSITIPDSVTSIGDGAFMGCSSLASIEIPDGVMSIGRSAFYDCSSLTSIEIPDGVTSIGESAFYDCSSLTGVYITDIAAWCKIAFAELDNYTNPLFYAENLYLNNVLVTEIVIPSEITEIKASTFFHCRSLKKVIIPEDVTSIGSGAFMACDNLTSIEIPDGVTSIGEHAFRACSSLTSITVPDSVTNIGSEAFEYCDGLTRVYYKGTAEEWAKISIGSYNTPLTNATIYYI